MKSGSVVSLSLLIGATSMVGAGTTLPALDVVPFVTEVSRGVEIIPIPGMSGKYFLAEQRLGSSNTARIRIWDRETNVRTLFLEIENVSIQGPQGLLSMAVDPDYVNNGYVYVNYTDFAGTSRIVRYARSAGDPMVADPASAHYIRYIAQLGPTHNVGWMDFGPDGFLYIGTGDGGNGGDLPNNAQNLSNGMLLGKILRIDVHGDDFPAGALNYAIPADNPYAGTSMDQEIWAYGFRHPWRCAFDSLTGDLYIADVGDATYEEINFQPASSTGGENYGWHCMEANTPSHPADCLPGTDFVDPVHFYEHFAPGQPFRCSIIGGEVYRGSAIPALDGFFLFADYCSGEIFAARFDAGRTDILNLTEDLQGCDIDLTAITGFSLDEDGEVLILARGSGIIYKIIPACGADVSHDGVVDFKDLNILLDNWGLEGGLGDSNGDCSVDFADLNAILETWGTSCP